MAEQRKLATIMAVDVAGYSHAAETDEAAAADAVFLCNAVRGILGVGRLGAREWPPHPALEAARIALSRLHPSFPVEPA